ncbi:MAG TPA: hypothetical protein PKA07_01970 [Micropruina sp.]|nr:hypothetical protein [Micropruina sp.]
MPNPTIPTELAEIIAIHKSLFGGWTMTATPPEPDPKQPDGTKPDDGGKDDGDKPLGPNGEKALAAERDARKKSDQKVAALEAQFAKLAEAFGVKPDESKPDGADKVDALAKTVDTILHNSTVDRVARDHGITDKDDLALLAEQATGEAMEKLAKRLQPAKSDDDGAKPKRRPPAPDHTQGRGGEKPTPGDAGKAEAERRFGKKQ